MRTLRAAGQSATVIDCFSLCKCSDHPRDLILHFLEVCFTYFWSGHCAPNAMQDSGKPNCMNTTGRKLIHCLYDTSHKTGRAKHDNRDTVTSGNVIVGFYCISRLKLMTNIIFVSGKCHLDVIGCICDRDFPWILEIFGLMPYNFYKIIEPLIRAEEGLWREVVKHLNHVSFLLQCVV